MSKTDKWEMFKNYMHNDIGITKDDIREWIMESAEHEAVKIVKNTFQNFDLRKEIRSAIKDLFYENPKSYNKSLKKEVESLLIEELKNKISITLKGDQNENNN